MSHTQIKDTSAARVGKSGSQESKVRATEPQGKQLIRRADSGLSRSSSRMATPLPATTDESLPSLLKWFRGTRKQEPPPVVPSVLSNPAEGSVKLEDYFLQPAEESEIQNQVTGLRLSIASHVDDHYSGLRDLLAEESMINIVTLKGQMGLPQSLEGAISEETARLAAIKHLITRVVIESISIDGDPETSFLPRNLVSLLREVPENPSKFEFAASAKLRRIAATLLRLDDRKTESLDYAEQRDNNIGTTAELLHHNLSELANLESGDSERAVQLEAIMRKAAQLGALLISQPETYDFNWSNIYQRSERNLARSSTNSMRKVGRQRGILFPALFKIGDSMGRQLRKAELLSNTEYFEEEYLEGVRSEKNRVNSGRGENLTPIRPM